MNSHQKLLWRAAQAIAEVYARRQLAPLPCTEPLPFDGVQRLMRLCRHAQRRGYRVASTRLVPRLERSLRDLAVAATMQAERLRAGRHPAQPPLAGTLYWDLLAIDDEFPSFEVDFKRRQLRVTTDPIELQEVSLGPFVLSIDWETLGEEQPRYLVTAIEPNTPAANPSVTHPHVVDDRLCEGEGALMLQAASLEGRLHDFAIVVRQILQTYNEASAYVDLDRWYGLPCSDCGVHVESEHCRLCGRCDDELCDECVRSCESCGEDLCHRCCDTCTCCDDNNCRSCLEPCGDCSRNYCHQCLTNGVCDACIDEKEAAAEARAASQVAAADAVRVGQAPLPA